MTPLARQRAMVAASIPNSVSTSSVCCPRPGIASIVTSEADTFGGAWRQVLYEDVGARQQLVQDRRCLRPLEIERQRLLRPIQPDEMARHAVDRRVVGSGEIATGRPLDFDDPGAEIGEMPCRKRGGDGLFNRHDRDVFKQFDHANVFPTPSMSRVTLNAWRLR